ncbi:uncharacterized protein LOC134807377 [Pan troglodytes]|uniref:uncharacterized protein LOC134807377 n=1 Tax=Pan troglodytes TaxID=9598 RepID=UPI0030133690
MKIHLGLYRKSKNSQKRWSLPMLPRLVSNSCTQVFLLPQPPFLLPPPYKKCLSPPAMILRLPQPCKTPTGQISACSFIPTLQKSGKYRENMEEEMRAPSLCWWKERLSFPSHRARRAASTSSFCCS